jgi:hypothetical protein
MSWSFDGHGINDDEGKRIATFSEEYRMNGKAQKLGYLLSSAKEMLSILNLTKKTINDPDAGCTEADLLDSKIESILKKVKRK